MSKPTRCECCGKYFIESTAENNKTYCSTECEAKYIRCTVCGDYYKIDKNTKLENFICSADCDKKYKFKKQRYGDKLDFSELK